MNQLLKIRDTEGKVWKKQKEIGQAFESFYQNRFAVGETFGVDECLAYLEARVIDDMNSKLLKEFTVGEVEVALS